MIPTRPKEDMSATGAGQFFSSSTPPLEATVPPQKAALDAFEMTDATEFTKLTDNGSNNHHGRIRFNPETTLFFRDGKRRVDFVLAYEEAEAEGETSPEYKRRVKRNDFETNLEKAGLQLETEPKENSHNGKTTFVKLHAPWDVLTKMAEMMRIKMPIQVCEKPRKSGLKSCLDAVLSRWNPFVLDEAYKTKDVDYVTVAFCKAQEHQFLIDPTNRDAFFSPMQRARIVWDILTRTRYDSNRTDRIGVERLITNNTYSAAFQLHEGEYITKEKDPQNWQASNDRELLYETWARPKRWFKYQPLDLIRRYFGEKITIYFAWLGFYTRWLAPAALIGFICVLYGVISLQSDQPSHDVCDANGAGSAVMCPQCDRLCPYWSLNVSCIYSRFTHVFDNTATVLFSIFMSVWATLFLEFWKRRQSELQWNWDLIDYELEEEQVRPEFMTKIKAKKLNPVTMEKEPYMPRMEKYIRLGASAVTVLFFLCLVLAFVFGIIVYRIIVVHLLFQTGQPYIQSYAKITTSVTAGLINLVVIIFLGRIYQALAWYLTDLEHPRTQTEFENSFTFKVFLFQFINYYSSLFYIAFFKGKFTTAPGNKDLSLFGTYRFEECDVAGCMPELLIQLAIIMVGKQLLNNFMEILFPIMFNWCRSLKTWLCNEDNVHTRWEKDYELNPVPQMMLFYEYLEMAIQYGFVTLFVAAFPLAPLFAFLNNIMEVRLDAYKFVTAFRRPKPYRARDLGIWYRILDGMSWFAVVCNAFVIAFTSDFVPRLLYKLVYSCDGTLDDYVLYSLSLFNVSDFDTFSRPEQSFVHEPYKDIKFCRYRDYRNPPCMDANHSNELMQACNKDFYFPTGSDCQQSRYRVTIEWWHVFAARLAFILVFEHIVFLIKGIVSYLIPDVPHDISIRIQRESMLAKQARFDYMIDQRRRASDHSSDRHAKVSPPTATMESDLSDGARSPPPGAGDTRRRRTPARSDSTQSQASKILTNIGKVITQDYGNNSGTPSSVDGESAEEEDVEDAGRELPGFEAYSHPDTWGRRTSLNDKVVNSTGGAEFDRPSPTRSATPTAVTSPGAVEAGYMPRKEDSNVGHGVPRASATSFVTAEDIPV